MAHTVKRRTVKNVQYAYANKTKKNYLVAASIQQYFL